MKPLKRTCFHIEITKPTGKQVDGMTGGMAQTGKSIKEKTNFEHFIINTLARRFKGCNEIIWNISQFVTGVAFDWQQSSVD